MSVDSKEMAKWLFDQEKEFASLDEFKEELAKMTSRTIKICICWGHTVLLFLG